VSEEAFDRTSFLREERRRALRAARAFVNAAQAGDTECFLKLALALDEEVDAWRLAMLGISRLPTVSNRIKFAFISIWVEHKHLALAVGKRRVMARGAQVLFPKDYTGPSLQLYRGTTRNERRRRLYGFSWTRDLEIAKHFAVAHNSASAQDDGLTGIVLQTVAPAAAILLDREQEMQLIGMENRPVAEEERFYNENEVVVDPFLLGKITLAR
jgi:hypothetical protein